LHNNSETEIMNQKCVLLVEDNPDEIALTQRAFRKCLIPHELIVAENGIEALDFLFCRGQHRQRDPADLPAVVLLDLKLPYVDGLEVLKRIRDDSRTSGLPVVIMTCSSEKNDQAESLRLGANGYFRKPVRFADFMDLIRQISKSWLDEAQLNTGK
jgi:two-component system, response regulator